MTNIYPKIKSELKCWTVWDEQDSVAIDITSETFKEGLKKKYIVLSGCFMKVEYGHKIWVDAIYKKLNTWSIG